MRIVHRESISEATVMRLAGSDRPVEVEAVIDANGRVKVHRIIDVDSGQAKLTKPIGRFVILEVPKGSQRQLS